MTVLNSANYNGHLVPSMQNPVNFLPICKQYFVIMKLITWACSVSGLNLPIIPIVSQLGPIVCNCTDK